MNINIIKVKYIITLLPPILFNENLKHSELIWLTQLFFRLKNQDSEERFNIIGYGRSDNLNICSNTLKHHIIKNLLFNKYLFYNIFNKNDIIFSKNNL